MDWVPNRDPFVAPSRLRHFRCGAQTGEYCRVFSSHKYNADNEEDDGNPVTQKLSTEQEWEELLEFVASIPSDQSLNKDSLQKNGYCILFIPAPPSVEIAPGPPPVTTPGAYTNFPMISNEQWEKVATAFRLPGHYDKVVTRKVTSLISIPRTKSFNDDFKEKLWMHVAMTHPRYGLPENPAFALAATHFQTRNFTFAIMVGCSARQIRRVKSLVQGWKDAVGHPLLMLGICAELHLERLEGLTVKQANVYQNLLKSVHTNAIGKNDDKFSWRLIEEVRDAREEGKKVEAEVNTTRLQLSNAVSSSICKLLAQYDTELKPSNDTYSELTRDRKGKSVDRSTASSGSTATFNGDGASGTTADPQHELELKIETTHLFEERFNDILSRLDRLSAECRISVEGISFTTDIIRSELARQEGQLGSKNAKVGVVISLIALTYLPLTAVASIMSMPIFQWTYDWRDWRYRPVSLDNTSTTTIGHQARLPVVSGYIAIYFPIAISLVVITLTGFASYYFQYSLKTVLKGVFSYIMEKLKRSSHTTSAVSSSSSSSHSLAETNEITPQDQHAQLQIHRPESRKSLSHPEMPSAPQTPGNSEGPIQQLQSLLPALKRAVFVWRSRKDNDTLQQSASLANATTGSDTAEKENNDSVQTPNQLATPATPPEPVALEKTVQHSQEQPSVAQASTATGGRNDDLPLQPTPVPGSAAKGGDAVAEEKRILAGTPGHQRV
ncbi:hypothetical protein NPX13_g1802 [Xylaria arbuscula]|uniref:Uncharacterized protein n=1 Tax=Xylaria arbuscula TaxID=114810 RepID=A0A9W8NLM2_9PEZI|nr:hypothetical protein NPX13_g1802 [Xylaria arbuscula]